ncbi:hypothetical protein PCY08_04760 [Streptococcus sp. SO4]|uniref:hypothetical protein n=1 Tax=Streptococcus sp. SO4 TaxID=3018249 RepID=UPI00263C2538|nr:hypothetical protein [Streptococcus sp. SO4]MDN5024751.1 hypothetical protein [Streptococcus sp. SO4]
MRKIDWDKIKTRLDALLVIDEYLTDPSEDWLRLVIKTEEDYGLRYLIDNGSGDSLDVILTDKMILYDGHAHQQTYQDQDGGEWLLSYLFDSFERFHEFVTDYYEITVDKDLLRKLYMKGFLSDLEVKQLIQDD